jgi:hypothetical protein
MLILRVYNGPSGGGGTGVIGKKMAVIVLLLFIMKVRVDDSDDKLPLHL